MTAEHTRLQLLAQHDRIRQHLETCTRLARLAGCDSGAGLELDAALGALRQEFAAHNEAETAIIRRLLEGPTAWGKLMVDRMFEEHVAEHAAFWDLLSGDRAEVIRHIEELADLLDAHMAAEERTFLAPATLREETLSARTAAEAAE